MKGGATAGTAIMDWARHQRAVVGRILLDDELINRRKREERKENVKEKRPLSSHGACVGL